MEMLPDIPGRKVRSYKWLLRPHFPHRIKDGGGEAGAAIIEGEGILTPKEKEKRIMYDPKSPHADDFIDHGEVMETLAYGEANKHNEALIDEILAKARLRKGLTHKEAIVLLDCDLEEKNQEMFALAEQIKKDFYGNRIVMFAPLYLSNYCVNGCVYCPYHAKNKHIARKKLTQEEIRREVIALQDCFRCHYLRMPV